MQEEKDYKTPRTYQISDSTIKRVKTNADILDCYPSTLVDFLLKRALDELENGNWQPIKRPVKYKLDW